jgi:hypothetical protein
VSRAKKESRLEVLVYSGAFKLPLKSKVRLKDVYVPVFQDWSV